MRKIRTSCLLVAVAIVLCVASVLLIKGVVFAPSSLPQVARVLPAQSRDEDDTNEFSRLKAFCREAKLTERSSKVSRENIEEVLGWPANSWYANGYLFCDYSVAGGTLSILYDPRGMVESIKFK